MYGLKRDDNVRRQSIPPDHPLYHVVLLPEAKNGLIWKFACGQSMTTVQSVGNQKQGL